MRCRPADPLPAPPDLVRLSRALDLCLTAIGLASVCLAVAGTALLVVGVTP